MKSLCTVIALCACLAGLEAAVATTQPRVIEVVSSGTTHRDLYAVAMKPKAGHGVAVGRRGTLLTTNDGGQSWTRQYLDTDSDAGFGQLALFDVALAGDRWLVVGQMGLVRYSDDQAQSWTKVEVGTDERLMGVSANADGLAVAVGSFGTILLSEDGGESWRSADFNVTEVVEDGYRAHLNDVHVAADGTVLVVGEFGLVLRSVDGGESWHATHKDSVSLFGLHVRANGEGYAVGQSGTVLHTADGGESWEELETGLDANLLGVHSSHDGTITVPGMRHMIVSDDQGATWQQVTAGDVDRNWYGAVAHGDTGALVVGHSERIIHVRKSEISEGAVKK